MGRTGRYRVLGRRQGGCNPVLHFSLKKIPWWPNLSCTRSGFESFNLVHSLGPEGAVQRMDGRRGT